MTWKNNLFAMTMILLALIILMGTTRGQDTKPLTPTADQAKDLKIKQDAAVIANQRMQLIQQSMQAAAAEYNQAVTAFNAEVEKVKKENKWPDGTTYDVQSGTFAPAKPAPDSQTVAKPVPPSALSHDPAPCGAGITTPDCKP